MGDVMYGEWIKGQPRWDQLLNAVNQLNQFDWFDSVFDFHLGNVIIVAATETNVVGFLRFAVEEIGSDSDCAPLMLEGVALKEAKVLAFGVLPDYRRQGIGTLLQIHAMEVAKQKGCFQMRSHSGGESRENHQVKLRLGFGFHPIIRGNDTSGGYFIKVL